MDTPEQLAQLLNALCVVGSGVLVLVLARLLLPGRPLARWSALAFFACCPVVLKTGAMFHPQPLAMFLSLLALTIDRGMIVRRDYRLRLWAALALIARRRPARPFGLDLGRRRRPGRARGGGRRAAGAPPADRDGARRLGARDRAAAAPLVPPPPVDGRQRDLRARDVADLVRRPVARRVLRRLRPAGRDHPSATRRARGRARSRSCTRTRGATTSGSGRGGRRGPS